MLHGTNGTILRVDLTRGTTTVETFDEAFYRRYPGGKALAAYHLLREMPAGADPLGPENVADPRDRPPHRGARLHGHALQRDRPFAADRRLRRVGGRRLLGPRAQDGRARRDHPHRPLARAGLALGEGRRRRDPRRSRPLGPGPAGRPGRDQGGGRREERPGPPDRPGRREPRPLRDAHERAPPLQRPDRDGRRHGLQERPGDRGEGLAAATSTWPTTRRPSARSAGASRRRSPEHPQGWDLRTKGTPGLTDGLNAGGILPTRNFRQGSFEHVEGDRLGRLRGDPQRHPHLLRLRRPLQAGDGVRATATPSPTRTTAPNTRRSPASARTARSSTSSSSPGPTSSATSSASTSSRPPAPSPSSWSASSTASSARRSSAGVDLRFGNGEALLEVIPLIAERQRDRGAAGPRARGGSPSRSAARRPRSRCR